MHEEVNQKVVSLCVRSAKMSATELEKVLKMFLDAQKQKKNQFAKGKQTLKELVGQNAGVTNIEVNEGNIKAFERVARKYGIDFALKKDKSCQPPKYYARVSTRQFYFFRPAIVFQCKSSYFFRNYNNHIYLFTGTIGTFRHPVTIPFIQISVGLVLRCLLRVRREVKCLCFVHLKRI